MSFLLILSLLVPPPLWASPDTLRMTEMAEQTAPPGQESGLEELEAELRGGQNVKVASTAPQVTGRPSFWGVRGGIAAPTPVPAGGLEEGLAPEEVFILVAEDYPQTQELIREAIIEELKPYIEAGRIDPDRQIQVVDTATAVRQRLAERAPQMAFTDMHLIDASRGTEVAQAVKEIDPSIPVMLIAAAPPTPGAEGLFAGFFEKSQPGMASWIQRVVKEHIVQKLPPLAGGLEEVEWREPITAETVLEPRGILTRFTAYHILAVEDQAVQVVPVHLDGSSKLDAKPTAISLSTLRDGSFRYVSPEFTPELYEGELLEDALTSMPVGAETDLDIGGFLLWIARFRIVMLKEGVKTLGENDVGTEPVRLDGRTPTGGAARFFARWEFRDGTFRYHPPLPELEPRQGLVARLRGRLGLGRSGGLEEASSPGEVLKALERMLQGVEANQEVKVSLRDFLLKEGQPDTYAGPQGEVLKQVEVLLKELPFTSKVQLNRIGKNDFTVGLAFLPIVRSSPSRLTPGILHDLFFQVHVRLKKEPDVSFNDVLNHVLADLLGSSEVEAEKAQIIALLGVTKTPDGRDYVYGENTIPLLYEADLMMTAVFEAMRVKDEGKDARFSRPEPLTVKDVIAFIEKYRSDGWSFYADESARHEFIHGVLDLTGLSAKSMEIEAFEKLIEGLDLGPESAGGLEEGLTLPRLEKVLEEVFSREEMNRYFEGSQLHVVTDKRYFVADPKRLKFLLGTLQSAAFRADRYLHGPRITGKDMQAGASFIGSDAPVQKEEALSPLVLRVWPLGDDQVALALELPVRTEGAGQEVTTLQEWLRLFLDGVLQKDAFLSKGADVLELVDALKMLQSDMRNSSGRVVTSHQLGTALQIGIVAPLQGVGLAESVQGTEGARSDAGGLEEKTGDQPVPAEPGTEGGTEGAHLSGAAREEAAQLLARLLELAPVIDDRKPADGSLEVVQATHDVLDWRRRRFGKADHVEVRTRFEDGTERAFPVLPIDFSKSRLHFPVSFQKPDSFASVSTDAEDMAEIDAGLANHQDLLQEQDPAIIESIQQRVAQRVSQVRQRLKYLELRDIVYSLKDMTAQQKQLLPWIGEIMQGVGYTLTYQIFPTPQGRRLYFYFMTDDLPPHFLFIGSSQTQALSIWVNGRRLIERTRSSALDASVGLEEVTVEERKDTIRRDVAAIAQKLRTRGQSSTLFGLGPAGVDAYGPEVADFLRQLKEQVPNIDPFLVIVGKDADRLYGENRVVLLSAENPGQAAPLLQEIARVWGADKLVYLSDEEDAAVLRALIPSEALPIEFISLGDLTSFLQQILSALAGLEANLRSQAEVDAFYGIRLNELAENLKELARLGV